MSEERSRVTIDVDEAIAALKDLGGQADKTRGKLKSMGEGADASADQTKALSTASNIAGSALKALVASATAATGAIVLMGERGSELNALGKSFELLGNTSAKLEELRQATNNMVSDSTLQRLQNMAQLSGLSADAVRQLAQVSVGASTAMGLSMEESFERIILSAAKLEKETLDELGIRIPNLNTVFDDFAKSSGAAVASLTEAQKQQAFIQSILTNSTNQLAIAQEAGGTSFGKATAQVKNAQDEMMRYVGSLLESAGAFELLDSVLVAVTDIMSENKDVIDALVTEGMNALALVLPPILEVFIALVPVLTEVIPIVGALAPSIQQIAIVVKLLTPLVAGLARILVQGLGLALSIAGNGAAMLIDALIPVVEVFDKGFAKSLEKASGRLRDASKGMDKAKKSLDKMEKSAKDAGKATRQQGAAMAGATAKTKNMTAAQTQLVGGVRRATVAIKAEAAATKQLADAIQLALDNMREFSGAAPGAGEGGVLSDLAQGDDKLSEAKDNLAAIEGHMNSLGDGVNEMVDSMEEGGANTTEINSAIIKMEEDLDKSAAGLVKFAQKINPAVKSLEDVKGATFTTAEGIDISDQINSQAKRIVKARRFLDKAWNEAARRGQEEGEKIMREEREKARSSRAEDDDDFLDAMREATIKMGSRITERKLELEEEYGSLIIALRGKNDELADALESRLHFEKFALQFEGSSERMQARLQDDLADSVQAFQNAADEIKAINKEPINDSILFTLERTRQKAEDTGDDLRVAGQEIHDFFKTLQDTGEDDIDTLGDKFRRGLEEISNTDVVSPTEELRFALAQIRIDGEATLEGMKAFGGGMTNIFTGLADGSLKSTEAMRQTMGSFFGDLAQVFIGWASATITNLFNPLAGLAASIAFQALVAPLLGSFAKKGAKASSGGSGGNVGAAARRTDREREPKDKGPQIVINNLGFATPDEIAMSIGRGSKRAQELRGSIS